MKLFWKKKYLSAFFLLLLIFIIAIFFWQKHLIKNASSIKATVSNSVPTTLKNTTIDTSFHFPIEPIYLQNDPRWKDDQIGGSEETLGKVGCFVSCVSMALAHHGIDLYPNQLNELLKANDGYTKQGWVKWYSISKITNNKINFRMPSSLNFTLINKALKAKEPVLVKILLYGMFPHWILIVGRKGQDYLVKDPLGDGKSLDKFSKFNSKIYAIRIVKKQAF